MNKNDIMNLFKAIDSFDTNAFVSYLDEGSLLRFGNMPSVKGKAQIHQFIDGFFQSIKAIKHDQLEIWETSNDILMNGRVTYTRHDDSELIVHFANTFKLAGNKISDYLIFVDTSELYKEAPVLQN